MPSLQPAIAIAQPATAAAEAITRPTLVDTARVSAGDTAWMLMSTALVLPMTLPGLALFSSGMVRKKKVLGTMAHSVATACVVTSLWVVTGDSLAFTPRSPFIGGMSRLMLHGMAFLKKAGQLPVHHVAPTIPEGVFMMFQMTFAIITPALIAGAFAERIGFSASFLFKTLWSPVVYALVAHWVWQPAGWPHAACSTSPVAPWSISTPGCGILVAALIIGPCTGFGKKPMPPHNLILTVIGGSLLWVD